MTRTRTPRTTSEPHGTRRWRLVLVLATLTVGVLVLDLARPAWTEPVHRASATVFVPVQGVLAGWSDSRLTELTRERNELAARVAQLEAEQELAEGLQALERSASWGDHELLPARVVGFAAGSAPVGGRTVTIDVGEQDGVTLDQTVVSVDGLVGRVFRVAPRSSDVLLLGDADVVVAVRFGAQSALGTVHADPPPGSPARAPSELTLTALGDTPVVVGDQVVTLGSPDSIPYAARIPLGTVTSVDPDRGQLGATAVVIPHVDPGTLDLVAVVFVDGP